MALADVYSARGDTTRRCAQYEEAVALRRPLGDPLLVVDAVYNSGVAAFHAGDYGRARDAFEDSLVIARELGEAPYIAAAQFMLASSTSSRATRLERARARSREPRRCTRTSKTIAPVPVALSFSAAQLP